MGATQSAFELYLTLRDRWSLHPPVAWTSNGMIEEEEDAPPASLRPNSHLEPYSHNTRSEQLTSCVPRLRPHPVLEQQHPQAPGRYNMHKADHPALGVDCLPHTHALVHCTS